MAGTDRWNFKLPANIKCKKNNYSSKIHIIHASVYIALFLPDSNNCFFTCLVPLLVFSTISLPIFVCICHYFLFLYFCFHLLFHAFYATKHNLQFTTLYLISLQPARKILHSPLRKKKCRGNYSQHIALIFSCCKLWVFHSSSSIFFLFRFGSGCQSRSRCLAHALIFLLNCKKHSETRKEHV